MENQGHTIMSCAGMKSTAQKHIIGNRSTSPRGRPLRSKPSRTRPNMSVTQKHI
jgi:hypothetical protein